MFRRCLTAGNFCKYGIKHTFMCRIWSNLSILVLSISISTFGQGNKISIEAQEFDYQLLRGALEEAHPGLYRYTSREKMDSLFDACEEGLHTPVTRREFYISLLPLVDHIQCGHTKLMTPDRSGYPYYFNTDRLFPLKLFIDRDRAYVIESYRDVPGIDKGDEVISIEGEAIPVIIKRLLEGIFSDGENMTFKYYELNRYFSAYYADIIQNEDVSAKEGFSIEILREGEPIEVRLDPATLEQVQAHENGTEGSGSFSLSFIENATAILTIPNFWNPEEGPGFKKFLKQSFTEINRRNTEHLIIDIRNNEGGKEVFGSLLLSYLMDHKFPYYDHLEINRKKRFSFSQYASVPLAYRFIKALFTKSDSGKYIWNGHKNCGLQQFRKNNYKGKVYILMNGGSFSVATEFASELQSLNRALFIGEESGGGYYGNTSGFFAVVILPHSNLELGIPLMGFYSKVKPALHNNRGIFPDFEIRPTVSGIINKRDEVLDYTLSFINKQ
jgi:hypothetical protein